MEQKLVTEILNFHLNLAKIKIQAQKIEDGLVKYSREWAQLASFREKCKKTQSVLARFIGKGSERMVQGKVNELYYKKHGAFIHWKAHEAFQNIKIARNGLNELSEESNYPEDWKILRGKLDNILENIDDLEQNERNFEKAKKGK